MPAAPSRIHCSCDEVYAAYVQGRILGSGTSDSDVYSSLLDVVGGMVGGVGLDKHSLTQGVSGLELICII